MSIPSFVPPLLLLIPMLVGALALSAPDARAKTHVTRPDQEREVVVGFTPAGQEVILRATYPRGILFDVSLSVGGVEFLRHALQERDGLISFDPAPWPLPSKAELETLRREGDLPLEAWTRLVDATSLEPGRDDPPQDACWDVAYRTGGEVRAMDVWLEDDAGRQIPIVDGHRPKGLGASSCAAHEPEIRWSPDGQRVVLRLVTGADCGLDAPAQLEDARAAEVPACGVRLVSGSR